MSKKSIHEMYAKPEYAGICLSEDSQEDDSDHAPATCVSALNNEYYRSNDALEVSDESDFTSPKYIQTYR